MQGDTTAEPQSVLNIIMTQLTPKVNDEFETQYFAYGKMSSPGLISLDVKL